MIKNLVFRKKNPKPKKNEGLVFFFSPCGIEEPSGLQWNIFYTAKLFLTNETKLLLITQPVAFTKLKYMIKQNGSDSTLSLEE